MDGGEEKRKRLHEEAKEKRGQKEGTPIPVLRWRVLGVLLGSVCAFAVLPSVTVTVLFLVCEFGL